MVEEQVSGDFSLPWLDRRPQMFGRCLGKIGPEQLCCTAHLIEDDDSAGH
jgi:hypothetical protein